MKLLSAEEILADSDYFASERLMSKICRQMRGKSYHSHAHLLLILRKHLGEKRCRYLEIGSYFGATLCLLLQSPYPTDLFGVDNAFFVDQRDRVIKKNILRFRQKQHSVQLIPGDSQKLSTYAYLKLLLPKVSILFLDGSRQFEDVQKDILSYSPLIEEGGFLVIDDYQDTLYCPGVRKAIESLQEPLSKNFYSIGSLPNLAKASISDKYSFRKKKNQDFSYNNLFILQKIPK